MIEPLNVLLVAPVREDPHPALSALLRAGFDARARTASTLEGLGVALAERGWAAVVIEAEGLPLDALDALAWARRKQPHTPVIVVGARPEDAVALVEAGATDLLEAAHVGRIGAAMAKALRDRSGPARPPDEAFHALAAHMPTGLYRSTPEGRILYANAALARVLGRESVEELLGVDVRRDLAYPRSRFEAEIAATGAVTALEVSWTGADGRTVHTREHARAVRDADGHLLYYEGTMEDVTAEREGLLRERRRSGQLEAMVRYCGALDSAASSEDLHRITIEAAVASLGASAAVLLTAQAGEYQVAAWSDGLGSEAVRACASGFAQALPPDALSALPAGVRLGPVACPRLAEAGYPVSEPFPLLHRGRVEGALLVLFQAGGGLDEGDAQIAEALAWHAASALARWEAERAVRASESTLRSIASATGHVLYRRRFGSAAYDYISDSVLPLTGYAPEEVNAGGGLLPLLVHTTVSTGDGLPEGRLPPEGEPYLALHRLRTRAGEGRWVEDRAYPWVVEGEMVGLVGVLEDVTERQRRAAAERAQARRVLEQQRALLRLSTLNLEGSALVRHVTEAGARVTDTARVSVWMHGGEAGPPPDGGHVFCRDLYVLDSQRHEALPPMQPADLGGGRIALREHHVYANADLRASGTDSGYLDDYYAAHDIQAVLVATIRRRGAVVGFVGFEHVGSPREWTPDEREFARALADLVALAEERTQRLRAEEALRASEARYRAVSEMTSDYAFAARYDGAGVGRLEWATRAFERITGYAAEGFSSPDELFERVVHPEDVALLREADTRLAGGEPVELTLRIVTRDGPVRWVLHRARPTLSAGGALETVFVTGQDLSERVRFEAELEEARDRAEAARTAAEAAQAAAEAMAVHKGDLLADMSHEIRTPLTGIIGFAEVLAEEVGDEHREFAGLIATSGRRLMETLNSVLDLAKLESGRLACEPVALDAAEEVRQVAGLLRPLAEAKGIALHLEAEGAAPALLDRGCLSRVIMNLAGNAVKFTDAGHVTVGLRADADALTLSVSDTGIGMDEGFLPHVFEEFRQESGGPERREGGSGLGLAITKRLVELMGGRISVSSAKGEGTTFTVSLPRALPPPPASEPPLAQADGPFAALFDSDEEAPLPPPPAALDPPLSYTVRPFLRTDLHEEEDWVSLGWPPREGWNGDGGPRGEDACEPPPVPPPRVLVVEDNDEARQLLQHVLGAHGTVDVARDALGALERMSRHAYDVLVLDIHLGGRQTGADVLRIARTLPGYETVTALAVTAYALPGDRERLLRDGFDAYLSKPFTAAGLLEALREAGVPVRP